MGDPVRAPWLLDVRAAVLRTVADPAFSVWAAVELRGVEDWRAAIAGAVDRWARTCRYRFDGAAHVVASWGDSRRRGWAACADALVVALALALRLRRLDLVRVAVETGERNGTAVPSYSHVRALLLAPGSRSVVVDPYERDAAPIRSTIDGVTGGELLVRGVPYLWRSSLLLDEVAA